MTPVEFCYWLRGFTELNPTAMPTHEQWVSIREHVGLATSDLSPAPINIACDRFSQWLHGYAQMSTIDPDPDQWFMIQERLRQVFVKVTFPSNISFEKGILRTMELRPSDQIMRFNEIVAPGSSPTITC